MLFRRRSVTPYAQLSLKKSLLARALSLSALLSMLLSMLLGMLFGLALAGCADKSQNNENNDEVGRAAYLVDHGQYSEAIYTLSKRVQAQPQDRRARVLLASAYAGRAGVQLTGFINFASKLAKWSNQDDLFSGSGGDPILREISKTTWRIHAVIEAFGAIPTVTTREAFDDLTSAHRVLREGGDLQGGQALYRALLKTALFKHSLITNDRPAQVTRRWLACRDSQQEVSEWLTSVAQDLREILEDVATGVKVGDTRKNISEFLVSMDNSLQDALKFTAKFAGKAGMLPGIGKGVGGEQCQ